ncbi:outer membrane lipoprotein carrier protein LolA [Rathayibacter sp. YIM 133350]|uniref:LolA family protein n=1 Tax=Rathayibacter sp. YIM 133350 TaxID=3131992 RepID=UPI00307FB6E9
MRGSRRWLPAILIPAAIAAAAVIAPLQAGAATDLADLSADQLVQRVAASDAEAFSGTFEQESQLGLPDLSLPGNAPQSEAGAASALELATGSHTGRVYVDGADHVRVQVLDALAERDAVRNGDEVWLYSSKQNEATHASLPDGSADAALSNAQTPGQLAEHFLTLAREDARLSVAADGSVADRPTYTLVITPTSTDTLVGDVRISVDAATWVPLRVIVRARGVSDPAFSLGFTTFDTARPDAERFAFTPPAGATVTERTVPAGTRHVSAADDSAAPLVHGSGWDAVAEFATGALPAELEASPLFSQLTNRVEGGRAVTTSLASLLLTDDGRILAGAVPLSRLQAAAAE